jgi:hypothetical protein
MENSQEHFTRKTFAGLVLAGFVSGILSVIVLEVLSSIQRLNEFRFVVYVPGVVFGVVISLHYAIFFRFRSWARLLALIAASTAAYFSAIYCTMYALFGFRELDWDRRWAFYGALFIGGLAGAFIVLTAGQLLLAWRRQWKRVLAAAALGPLAGGVLGVAGFALGDSLGKLLWLALNAIGLVSDASLEAAVSNQNVNMFSLLVVWQTCMVPVLGSLVVKRAAAQSQSQSATSA